MKRRTKILSKVILLAICTLFTSTAQASSARVGISYTTADGLWVGDKEVNFKDAPNATGEGTRTTLQYNIGTNYNLAEDKSLAFNLTYSEAKMNDTAVADAAEGASRRGISEIRIAYMQNMTKRFIKIDLGIGARLPGDNKSPDTFIALNDGFSKYDFHANFSKRLGKIDLSLNNRYTIRPTGHNQSLVNLNVATYLTSKVYFGLGYAKFNTFDGTDILGPGFEVTGSPGFSRVKEAYTQVSATGALILKDNVIDLTFATKTQGENTDMSNTFAIGFSKYY